MAGLIQDLISNLDEQALCYDQLRELSKEKKQVIIDNDTTTLSKITSLENTLAGKAQRLEKTRISITKDISLVLNKKEEDLTLSAMAEIFANKPEGEKLIAIAEKIRSAVNELKTLNDQNRVLINSSLEYIDFSINVLRSAVNTQPALYSSKGREIDGGSGFFDAKQ